MARSRGRRAGGPADRRTGGRSDHRTGGRSDGRTGAPTHRRSVRFAAGDDAPRVLVERRDGVATLTLNRPAKRNALDGRMVAELAAALATCDLAADVRVVVLRGAGRDFCAGADLAELLESVGRPPEENERRALALADVLFALRALPKPTVAVVEGRAIAGGCGLALGCDLVVARADATLGFPETGRGFVPAMVLVPLRRAVGAKVAFDLAATGRMVDGREAERLGLVSRALPARGFDPAVARLVSGLAGLSPSALALLKQEFHRLDGMGFEEGVRLGARVNAVALRNPDFARAVGAFLGR